MKMSLVSFLFVTVWTAGIYAGTTGAETDENLENLSLSEVQDEIQALLDRVDELEKNQKEERPAWMDRWTFKGDFRFRFEHLKLQGKEGRQRVRIRARIFTGVKVNDDVDFGFQLATGQLESAGIGADLRSANQTLTNGFSGKYIWLDMAYADYHPVVDQNGWDLKFIGGKFHKPWIWVQKSEVMWDADLRPEGIVAKTSYDADALEVLANVGWYPLREFSTDGSENLVAGQLYTKVPISNTELMVGGGYFQYNNLKGNENLTDPSLDVADQGNSSDANGDYLYDYHIWELFGNYGFDIGKMPLNFFGDYVVNMDPDRNRTGWAAGLKLGKAKAAGSWDFRWYYRVVGKDAVVGSLTDSDFALGMTDSKGHEFNFTYALATNWVVAFSYFYNKIGISDPSSARNFERLMIDLKFKF